MRRLQGLLRAVRGAMGGVGHKGRHRGRRGVGQSLRVVHRSNAAPQSGLRASRWPPAKASLAVLLIIARECANLLPSDELAWRAYLSSNEALLLCLSLWIRPWWLRYALCALFASQCLDELTEGNLFANGMWEYPAILVMASAAIAIRKAHDNERGKEIKGELDH